MSDFVLTAAQMRAADKYSSEKLGVGSCGLMLNAAKALCSEAVKLLSGDKSGKILIFCGKGNNGGDGFAAADFLYKSGYGVKVFAVFGTDFKGDAATAYKNCEKSLVYGYEDSCIPEIRTASLIIDCIFGTGFSGSLTPEIAKLISIINSSSAKKLCCDVPSGCSCDDGRVDTVAVKADVTVTFAAYKPCFFLFPASESCGRAVLADISMPEEAIMAEKPLISLITEKTVGKIIKKRPQHSHKGTFGGVQLVCGSEMMTGAAVLAAEAALRCGTGLVYIESDGYVRRILQTVLPEPVYVKHGTVTKATAYVAGCGLGKKAGRVKDVLATGKPLVIDADSVTYISRHPNIMKRKHGMAVLTPHPLEMAKLCGMTLAEIESDRLGAALKAAERFGSVIILKGSNTVIACPDGRVFINTTGNSGLSKGGSGDVLSGMTGSFLAQGYEAWESAVTAVYLHGKAADELSETVSEHGLLPSDIPRKVAELLRVYE